jgi:sialidase-1
VLACGFMIRAADAATYYYVHFDRGQAILVRSDNDQSWNELRRVSNLDKPAGQWHEGRLECVGDKLKVYLNGTLLYEHQDQQLARGRIGFYAGQGRAHIKDIVVQGVAHTPAAEFQIPPRPFVYVLEDAGAGGYEAFPDVCRLQDGRLMAVCYAGYGHVSMPTERLPRGGQIACCTSNDEGRSWSKPALLYDGPHDDRDPSIVQLKSGRLICNFFSLDKSGTPDKNWIGYGTWMVTSDDLGRTWTPARQIAADAYCSAPIRELSDGRLILGLYRELNGTASGAVTYSDDAGETWSPVVDIDNGGQRLDAETDIIELKDGTLYAAQRPAMCFSVSADRGRTWSVSKPIGFEGHCPYLLRTADNIIVLAHRLPGTSLHYSLDEGKTWSQNVPVDTVGGAYPSMVNLKDGSVLIVYYEEGDGSSIRAKRFRVTADGVKWVPFAESEHTP